MSEPRINPWEGDEENLYQWYEWEERHPKPKEVEEIIPENPEHWDPKTGMYIGP